MTVTQSESDPTFEIDWLTRENLALNRDLDRAQKRVATLQAKLDHINAGS